MKAPLTGNSITDRVIYTGLYIPEADAKKAAADAMDGAVVESDGAAAEPALEA